MPSVYEAVGGLPTLLNLAAAWHHRVLADDIVAHAFQGGSKPDHTERLASYWGEALGGPPAYSERYADETTVVRMHSGNGPHDEMNQRAIACFDEAMNDVSISSHLRPVLHDYFAWATVATMNHFHDPDDQIPADLRIPQWSWEGLVRGW